MQFLDPTLIENPYPHYETWRNEHPIWFDEPTQSYILSRHDDVNAVLKDAKTYSSSAMGQNGDSRPLPLLTDDPPRHTQLRGLVNKAFTSRIMKSMEADIAGIAKELLERISPNANVDIAQQLTIPLPVAVISRMMGIPEERSDDFKRWSDALTGTLAGVPIEEIQKDVGEMAEFFQSLIPERRKHPGDDLVSGVVNAEIDGERLSDADIVGFNILLLIAGNETTTNLLGNLLNVLAERPDLWTTLKQQPNLIEASIEETLRYDSPVQFLMRTPKEPLEFYGQEIKVGETVTVVTGSANRDERFYDEPKDFRLDRNKNRHHAFGYGIHFCIGAPLARLEAKIAMQALTARFSGCERAGGQDQRVSSHLLRGFEHLWLQFEG